MKLYLNRENYISFIETWGHKLGKLTKYKNEQPTFFRYMQKFPAFFYEKKKQNIFVLCIQYLVFKKVSVGNIFPPP